MGQFKTFLGITVPIAIIVFLFALFSGTGGIWNTIGPIALGYAILGGIMWKFVKHI